MIPRRLVRTVPAAINPEQERLWEVACQLHPDWDHITLRDPVDTEAFPITRDYWDTCESGAQLADLIRAEELFARGGVYIDADYLCWHPFDPLLPLDGFVAWEDATYIPNACMGFSPHHPALLEVLSLAIERHGQGTWEAGVGVTTEVFTARDDLLRLPPGSLYPVHWRAAHRTGVDVERVRADNPWAFGVHLYEHSWWKAKR